MKGISLLFENSEILLVNKEAGVSVQGGAGVSHPLDEELSRQVGYKVHLVHRLDKDTAGMLIVAKNSAAAARWMQIIAGKEVVKEYHAVCIGLPRRDGRDRRDGSIQTEGTLESTVEAHGRIQKAVSRYRLERRGLVLTPGTGTALPGASGGGAESGGADRGGSVSGSGVSGVAGPEAVEGIALSFLSIRIETGRMHQIRIQTAQAGFPVAGDDQHGDFRTNKLLRKAGIKKLMLAATRLTIPLDGGSRTFEIPLPPHMQAALDAYFPPLQPE